MTKPQISKKVAHKLMNCHCEKHCKDRNNYLTTNKNPNGKFEFTEAEMNDMIEEIERVKGEEILDSFSTKFLTKFCPDNCKRGWWISREDYSKIEKKYLGGSDEKR